MKILVTGKNGQLGFELQRALAPLGVIVAVDREECDLSDATAIRALVRATKPDLIVNPAAYTAVDRAENEPGLATALNAIAPQILGEEATRIGAGVIHYSTDYVFDGTSPLPYRETDTTNPLNVYGRTKRDGDLALQQSCPQHLIFRTSWVVGAHGNNFAKTMLRLALKTHPARSTPSPPPSIRCRPSARPVRSCTPTCSARSSASICPTGDRGSITSCIRYSSHEQT